MQKSGSAGADREIETRRFRPEKRSRNLFQIKFGKREKVVTFAVPNERG